MGGWGGVEAGRHSTTFCISDMIALDPQSLAYNDEGVSVSGHLFPYWISSQSGLASTFLIMHPYDETDSHRDP